MSNDRLKFRVWWKKQNRYLRNPVLIFGKIGTGTEIFEEGKLTQCVRTDETEIEQCTGLRDTNGNLIYESDIVQLRAEDNTFVSAVVVWQNGCFCPGDDEPFGDSRMWEIIGNVHTEEQKQ